MSDKPITASDVEDAWRRFEKEWEGRFRSIGEKWMMWYLHGLSYMTVANETVCGVESCKHTFFDHEGWIDDPKRIEEIKKHRTIGCRVIGCGCPSFVYFSENEPVYKTWGFDGD